ncbi:trehalose operon transcriptional repressor [Liquorilactobacillus aquaticus DSM 21051]|uniref:Trehalose operon repressor n=1 Tax=Liquorilactobacillus aquaticus DSM 21051 TaxID=1423725 RepID=A0A0R2CV90_9LACO|nr:trehalose operon repressor [Liquorilactobacillus aquaticus]KRM95376.1 trehalose operon transcriptional repressor [Liquorilactobacillus aquaticus DSM 21051]
MARNKPTKNKQNSIAQDIALKIRHEQYRPGTFLPSEHHLCDLYGSSRETIRKALEQLTELGLIQKMRGKGSLVLDIQRFSFPVSGITSFQELNKTLGMHATTEVLQKKNDMIPDTLAKGRVDSGRTALHIERLRKIDQVPIVLDEDYLLNPPISEVSDAAAASSLYAYFEKELGLDISYATKEITVEKVSDRTASLLALDENKLAVVIRSMTYLADTTPFQLTASYHKPDRFKFIDFARRRKISF